MEDENIFKRINELAAEEHELFQKESRGEATEADVERLRHLAEAGRQDRSPKPPACDQPRRNGRGEW